VRAAADRLAGRHGAAAASRSRTAFTIRGGSSGPVGGRAAPGPLLPPDPRSLSFGWGIPLQGRGAEETLAEAAAAHIGELHTEVTTPAPPAVPAVAPAGGAPGAAERAERSAWVAHRVRAEGFDD
jgi:hypothetical protein